MENNGGGTSIISGSATSNQTFILPASGGTLSVGGGGGGGVGNLQEVTNSGNTTTGEIVVDGLNIGAGSGTGANCTRVGEGALRDNGSGARNTAIGAFALNSNATGADNTAVGVNALLDSTAASNTAVGSSALANVTGGRNIGIGHNAGNALTDGGNNTIIGSLAGTSGIANTMLFCAGNIERFRVDANGRMMLNTQRAAQDFWNFNNTYGAQVTVELTGNDDATRIQYAAIRNSENTDCPFFAFGKSRGTSDRDWET